MTAADSSQHTELDHNTVIIGEIAGVYGIKGWVKVLSYTRPRNNITNYSPWQLINGDSRQPHVVSDCKVHGKGIIAKLDGINDRDAAIAIVRNQIAIARSSLAPLSDGEHYWHELMGLEVVNRQQQFVGRVTDIQETGANDVLVVQGKTRELIPWVREVYVLDIDITQGRIMVDWEYEDPEA